MNIESNTGHAERSLGVVVREVNEANRTASFVASTDAIDSYGELVDQSEWNLERFKSNPVAFFSHRTRELPIGTCTQCDVVQDIKGRRLECTIQFSTEDLNPEAERVWRNVKAGVLKAVSVGFRPGEIRYEMRDGKNIYVLAKNELYEISVVPIPANPEALAKDHEVARQRAAFTNHTAERAVTETNDMDLTQLKTALADAEKSLKDATERSATADKALADANAAKDAAESRAVELEARATTLLGEKTALETTLSNVVASLGGAKDKAAADGEQPSKESPVEVAERVFGEILARDVDALIGVKITPAQKADFLALAKKDRGGFDAIVKGLPELKMLAPIMGAASTEERDIGGASVDAPNLFSLDTSEDDVVVEDEGDDLDD